MCGSGTIPIEAALMANNIPPGKFRSSFGFTRWKDYDSHLFGKIKNEADSGITKSSTRINASDISASAVRLTGANLEKAGLAGQVSLEVSDFMNVKPEFSNGYVFMNPPYGQRIQP